MYVWPNFNQRWLTLVNVGQRRLKFFFVFLGATKFVAQCCRFIKKFSIGKISKKEEKRNRDKKLR